MGDSAGQADAADLYDSQGVYVGTLDDLGALADLAGEFEADETGAFGEAEYDAVVHRLVERRGVSTWPHSWADSTGTAWAWRYSGNAVQVYRRGGLYAALYPTFRKPRPRRRSPFPTMIDGE